MSRERKIDNDHTRALRRSGGRPISRFIKRSERESAILKKEKKKREIWLYLGRCRSSGHWCAELCASSPPIREHAAQRGQEGKAHAGAGGGAWKGGVLNSMCHEQSTLKRKDKKEMR